MGIWRLTCQALGIAPGSAETAATVSGAGDVTTGAEVTPSPLRNSDTVEPVTAGFRQVLTEPSELKASGNSPLTDAED